MGYEVIDGVYKYSESPSKGAVAWQGYDLFPGMDQYENRVLKAETKLVKLEPSGSGYFTTLETYENLKKNNGEKASAIVLSEGLQVAPWSHKIKGEYGNTSTTIYEYRSEVAIVELQNDIEVAYGNMTLANAEYGDGKFPQIYITGYDSNVKDNNVKIGLKEIGREKLEGNTLSKAQWIHIQDKHEQQLLKRNLFCYQNCKDNLMDLKEKTNDIEVKKYCEEKIGEVEKNIYVYKLRIKKSITKVGDVKSTTYDNLNTYLHEKAKSYSLGKENIKLDPHMEKRKETINLNLMRKVHKDSKKDVAERNINVDELKKAYDIHIFCNFYRVIQSKTAQLESVEKYLATVDRYKDIAEEFDKKGLTKDAYRKKFEKELTQYEKALAQSQTSGITNWQEYRIEKTKLDGFRTSFDEYNGFHKSPAMGSMAYYKARIAERKTSDLQNIGNLNKGIGNIPKVDRGIAR